MEIKQENIKGGTCCMCGVEFGKKWANNAKWNVRNVAIRVTTDSGPSTIKLRICKSHWPIEKTDYQAMLDAHILFWQTPESVDGVGQPLRNVATWKLDEEYYAA